MLIGHNIVKYDLYWTNHHWKSNIQPTQVIDTLVMSSLYSPNLEGGHSLEAYGERLRYAKGSYSDWSHLTAAMVEYCLQDCRLTIKVYKALVKKLTGVGFSNRSIEIEHLVAPIIGEQQRNGFEFDKEGALNLYLDLRRQQKELEEKVHLVFPAELVLAGEYKYKVTKDGTPFASYLRHKESYPKLKFNRDRTIYRVFKSETFNIGSPAQRLERLKRHGYAPTKLTKAGNPSVDEDSIVEFAKSSGIPEVQMIADWLVLNGRASMIQTWLDNLGLDNRIHGNVFSCGAQSRRMKHSSPNTANIPRTNAKYGSEVRALWIARPGRVLVGVDAASLEGRMFYHHLVKYVEDEETRKFVWSQVVDGSPHKNNSKELTKAGINCSYEDAKTEYYAFMYGAQDPKLGGILKGDAALGARIRTILGNATPGLAALMDGAQQEWDTMGGLLQTIDGGFVRCPSKRAAVNYKLQPDGAVFMKLALILAHQYLTSTGMDFLFVGNIHDEWQIDTTLEHAEHVGYLCCLAMEEAGKSLGFNVPLAGNYKIGLNWKETH